MDDYYKQRLSAERLRRCYDIAPPRVRRYLEAETDYVAATITPGGVVLELGCGYGRILPRLATRAATVIGIDNSWASLCLAQEYLRGVDNCYLACMDAVRLGFDSRSVDGTVCIQNGLSAFHVDQHALIRECVRITKPGGKVVFTSYSDRFWGERLRWFERQAQAGLLGEIDYERTGDGMIVCKDGFTATTIRPADFRRLTAPLDKQVEIVEVDASSLVCVILV